MFLSSFAWSGNQLFAGPIAVSLRRGDGGGDDERAETGSALSKGQHGRADLGQSAAGAGSRLRAARLASGASLRRQRRVWCQGAQPEARLGRAAEGWRTWAVQRGAGMGAGSSRPLAVGSAGHAQRDGGGWRGPGPAPAGDRYHHARWTDVLSGHGRLRRVRTGDDPQPRHGGPGPRQGPRRAPWAAEDRRQGGGGDTCPTGGWRGREKGCEGDWRGQWHGVADQGGDGSLSGPAATRSSVVVVFVRQPHLHPVDRPLRTIQNATCRLHPDTRYGSCPRGRVAPRQLSWPRPERRTYWEMALRRHH